MKAMNLRTLILMGGGYLAYRLIKNKDVKIPLSKLFQSKQKLEDTPELVQCAHCKSYVAGTNALHQENMDFCCDECADAFFEENP